MILLAGIKYFGLVDMGQLHLQQNTTPGFDCETPSAVILTTTQDTEEGEDPSMHIAVAMT